MTRPTRKQIERTRTLYAVISGVPAERVNMTYWRGVRVGGADSVSARSELPDHDLLNECGTVACGMGYAAAYPPFVAEGMCMRPDESGFYWNPEFEGEIGFGAACTFFGMTGGQARAVFGGDVGYGPDGEVGIRGGADGTADRSLDEKPRLLRRLRRYLLSIGAITAERNAELAHIEGSPE